MITGLLYFFWTVTWSLTHWLPHERPVSLPSAPQWPGYAYNGPGLTDSANELKEMGTYVKGSEIKSVDCKIRIEIDTFPAPRKDSSEAKLKTLPDRTRTGKGTKRAPVG